MQPKFEEKTKISGMTAVNYFANLLDEFEKDQVDIAKANLTIGYMRQVNNANNQLLRAMLNGI